MANSAPVMLAACFLGRPPSVDGMETVYVTGFGAAVVAFGVGFGVLAAEGLTGAEVAGAADGEAVSGGDALGELGALVNPASGSCALEPGPDPDKATATPAAASTTKAAIPGHTHRRAETRVSDMSASGPSFIVSALFTSDLIHNASKLPEVKSTRWPGSARSLLPAMPSDGGNSGGGHSGPPPLVS
jgi:hypothetical protein